jgi:hypothetical protein
VEDEITRRWQCSWGWGWSSTTKSISLTLLSLLLPLMVPVGLSLLMSLLLSLTFGLLPTFFSKIFPFLLKLVLSLAGLCLLLLLPHSTGSNSSSFEDDNRSFGGEEGWGEEKHAPSLGSWWRLWWRGTVCPSLLIWQGRAWLLVWAHTVHVCLPAGPTPAAAAAVSARLWLEEMVLMAEAAVEAAAAAAADIVAAATAVAASLAATGSTAPRTESDATGRAANVSAASAASHSSSSNIGGTSGAQVAANPILGYSKAYHSAVVLQGERELLLRVLALVDTIEPAVQDMVVKPSTSDDEGGDGGSGGADDGAGARRNANRVRRLYRRDYSAALYIAKLTAALALDVTPARTARGVSGGTRKRR